MVSQVDIDLRDHLLSTFYFLLSLLLLERVQTKHVAFGIEY